MVRKHANENWKIFFLSTVLMIIPALLQKLIYGNIEPNALYFLYFFFLTLTGMLFTGTFLKNWSHKSRATTFLMLPSTTLEKISVVLFYTIILIIPIFTIGYYFFNYALYTAQDSGISFSVRTFYIRQSFLSTFPLRVLLPYAFFQSLFLLNAIWLKKRQIVITLAVIILSLILINIWNYQFIKGLTGGVTSVPGSQWMMFPSSVNYRIGGSSQLITSDIILNICTSVYSFMTLMFYMASYFKLKEKEI